MSSPTATALNILSAASGCGSSVVLFIWSLKAGPLQRTLSVGDSIDPTSPLHQAKEIDAAQAKREFAEVVVKEPGYIRWAAILLFISFALTVVAQFV